MMADITFEILKLIVMVCTALVTAYVIPWIRKKVGDENISVIADWTQKAVWYAQQTMSASSGAMRKQYVMGFLKEIVQKNKIPITDEQLEILVEAAVKELRIEEAKGQTGDDLK